MNGRRERLLDLIVKYGSDTPNDDNVDLDLSDCACELLGANFGLGYGGADIDVDRCFGLCNDNGSLKLDGAGSTVSPVAALSLGLGSGRRILPPAPEVTDSAFINAFANVSCNCLVASCGSVAPYAHGQQTLKRSFKLAAVRLLKVNSGC